MQIDKSRILELLRAQGKHVEADEVEAHLPNKVDTHNAQRPAVEMRSPPRLSSVAALAKPAPTVNG